MSEPTTRRRFIRLAGVGAASLALSSQFVTPLQSFAATNNLPNAATPDPPDASRAGRNRVLQRPAD